MNDTLFLPRRCLVCGEPAHQGPLCFPCLARCSSRDPGGGLGACTVCGQVRLAEHGPCVDCAAQAWSFPVLDGLWGYQDTAGELLRLYKFGGQTSLVHLWAGPSAARLVPRGPLVPVPALRRHLWSRGWDPVLTLARALAREASIPVWRVLARRPSASQKSLDRTGRQSNAARAYSLASGRRNLRGVPLVWLVDDVVTTGSTVEACSRLLRSAGVEEVRVFCLGLH